MLKIYPTVVTKNTKLYSLWKKRAYTPLGDQEFKAFILRVKNNLIPPYVRIARLVRDVPTSSIEAGPTISNLRQLITNQSRCQCIRCREVKSDYTIGEKIVLDRIDYTASNGTEIFLQYVSADKKKLFALLRLRIPDNHNINHFIPILRKAALVREVHTYGKLTSIDTQDKNSPQHIGLGRKLLLEAERITSEEFSLKKIAVISGVGVRHYYRKNGYHLRDTYLIKNL
jgi:elongator complex protein 3